MPWSRYARAVRASLRRSAIMQERRVFKAPAGLIATRQHAPCHKFLHDLLDVSFWRSCATCNVDF